MYKCINCKYEGAEAKDKRFCPVCGDNVINSEDKKKIESEEKEDKVILSKVEDLKSVAKGPLFKKR